MKYSRTIAFAFLSTALLLGSVCEAWAVLGTLGQPQVAQSPFGINGQTINGGRDFGLPSSQFPAFDPNLANRYHNFSDSMIYRNQNPMTGFSQGSMYGNQNPWSSLGQGITQRYGGNQPTVPNLITGIFDIFLGQEGTMMDRWNQFWKYDLLLPYGVKAGTLALAGTNAGQYLLGADRTLGALAGSTLRTGGRVMNAPFQFQCDPSGNYFRTNPYAGIGQSLRFTGY